ncbi:Gfo/Idh/MocA family protein [Candidatus Poribacteria bacterium]
MSKIKWGIIGTGGIAGTFANALGASETGELFAVGSRAQETADAFGEKFGIPRRYSSYDDLFADSDVDAIYNSLPNSLHLEWSVKAARAGKHILCEKPLTVNAGEAEQMIAAIKEADVFLMEAFMYRCHPQTAKLVELIRDGAIGDVRFIQASFCYDMGDSDEAYQNIRLRNDVCGGGIMDVGCYTVSIARLIAGAALGLSKSAEPESVCGAAHIGERGRVDEWASAAVRFPNGVIANLLCACRASVPSTLYVWGTKGSMEVPDPWKPNVGKIILKRSGEEPEEMEMPAKANSCYTLEADVVAGNLSKREAPYPCMTWEDSINNMEVLDQWRDSIGLVFDMEK